MNSSLIRPLILGVFAFPLLVVGQMGSGRVTGVRATTSATIPTDGEGGAVRYSDPGNNFFSNVPINELSAKAFRRFHRRFREVTEGEYWFKYAQGYQVSFMLDQHHEFA